MAVAASGVGLSLRIQTMIEAESPIYIILYYINIPILYSYLVAEGFRTGA